MELTQFQRYPSVSAEYEYYGRNSGLPSFVVYPDDVIVQLQDRITDEWITSLFRLNGTTNPTLRRIVPSMFKAIPKETIVASIEIDGRMVASGLASWIGDTSGSMPSTSMPAADTSITPAPSAARF